MPRSKGTPTVDGARFMLEQQKEVDFQAAVIQHAERLGWRVYHTHNSKNSQQGFPDLVMVRSGRLVIAELKREIPDGAPPNLVARLSPTFAQTGWLEALGSVTRAIADALAESAGTPLVPPPEAMRFMADATALLGVYLWRPSNWPDIEKVLR